MSILNNFIKEFNYANEFYFFILLTMNKISKICPYYSILSFFKAIYIAI